MGKQNLRKTSTKTTTNDGKVKKKVAKQFTFYKCKFCKKKFTEKYNCTSHEKIHSDDVFPCPDCPYKGKTKKYLARHKRSQHMPKNNRAPSAHKCNICGKMFRYKSNLREHAMVHTGEKPHKCEVCGKAFRVMFSLNNHMLIHTNQKPYKCSFCDYACRDNSTLRKHENRHMGLVKMFTCKICQKKFPNKAKLKYHISEMHLDYLDLDLKKFSCEKCDTAFKSKYNLKKHIEAVHDKSLQCACPVCGRRVSNRNNLPAHLRTHFRQRPHKCAHTGCGKAFKDKCALKKHSIIHSPHLHHPCGACGATFSRAHRLAAHARTHAPRERSLHCDYCGVAFYTKNYLIKHIAQKHSVNKQKYICDRCGLLTYNKPSIVMHLKYGHRGDQDLCCKICKREYKRHICLKAHYLKVHNVKYKPMKRCKRKDSKPPVEVKVEPVDSQPFGEIQILTVHKEELIEDEEDPNLENDLLSYSKKVLSEDLAECLLSDRQDVPENVFDEFLFKQVFHQRVKEEDPTEEKVDEEQQMLVTEKIKEIIKNARENEAAKLLEKRQKREARMLERKLRREAKAMRRKRRREIYELEKVRQMYNEIMRAAVNREMNKKEPVKILKYFKQKTTDNTNTDIQTDETIDVHSKELFGDLNDENVNENDSNDINHPSNDADEDKIADTNETVLNNATSEGTSKNDYPLNDNNNELIKDSETADSSILNLNKYNDSTKDLDSQTKQLSDDTKSVNDNDNDKSVNDDKDGGSNDDKDDGSNDDKDDGSNDDKGDGSNDDDADSSYEPDPKDCPYDESPGNKRLKFKTHQCYICFKLYPHAVELESHCARHFPQCSGRTLARCPACGHVAAAGLAAHLRTHGLHLAIPYHRISRRDPAAPGSKYCYKVDDTVMEIIPSVKALNHNAAVEIDKRNRERKDQTIAKTRLVKKGKEWIVENVAVNISFEELPEFPEQELSRLNVSDSYADRLGQLSRLAKKKGIKMLFPCNRCDKICQNLSALKLHGRRHDPNKKPFAPRKYKRDANPAPVTKKPEVTNLENRHAKPKPIQNKHKCDEKLKKFYETHIRGADIEFWQFLKIFNKMDRDNIKDFKDFEGTTEFGIHTNEDRSFNNPEAVTTNLITPEGNDRDDVTSSKGPAKSNKLNQPVPTKSRLTSKMGRNSDSVKKPVYKRVIMISKKQHREREKAKIMLREKLKAT